MKGVLEKAGRGEGLTPEEAVFVFEKADPGEWREIFALAKRLGEKYFHSELRFFAPLYFSDVCVNDCEYCGFKRSNPFKRKALSPESFIEEARFLWAQGHRSILLVAAEHPVFSGPLRIANYLMQLQKNNLNFSVAIEVGPFRQSEYRELAEMGIKRCVLYQETYDRQLYARLHKGPKEDFDYRYEALGRALAAGIPEVGIGFLLGLSEVKAELAALIRHAQYLYANTGKYPATFSLPRIRPARGTENFSTGIYPVEDETFKRIIALLKIAVPSAGIVLTTRETAELRDDLLRLGIGVTHLSAGVHTETGGYTQNETAGSGGQFEIQDERSLGKVVEAVRGFGYDACDVSVPGAVSERIAFN